MSADSSLVAPCCEDEVGPRLRRDGVDGWPCGEGLDVDREYKEREREKGQSVIAWRARVGVDVTRCRKRSAAPGEERVRAECETDAVSC